MLFTSTRPRSFSTRRLRMPPRNLQSMRELLDAQRVELRGRPALPSPGIRYRRKCVGRRDALQLLLIGRELEIGGAPIGRERNVDARHLERGAVEVRRLGRAV